MAKDPTEVIRKAVLRMLPRNKLRDVSIIANALDEVPFSHFLKWFFIVLWLILDLHSNFTALIEYTMPVWFGSGYQDP